MLSILLPLIVLVALGIILRHTHIISESGISDIKTLVSTVCLPAVVFPVFSSMEFTSRTLMLLVAMSGACVLAFGLGLIGARALRIGESMAPFLASSFEGGMIGYALFILLFGSSELGTFAILDLGNAFVVFLVLLTLLRTRRGAAGALSSSLRSLITPLNITIVCAICASLTGFARRVEGTAIWQAIIEACGVISAPTSALILIVVGYGLSFTQTACRPVLLTVALRWVAYGGIGIAMWHLAGALFEPGSMYQWATEIAFILPPTFLYAVACREEEQGYVNTVIGIDTLATLAAFALLASVAPHTM